jgi:hypothetical protein
MSDRRELELDICMLANCGVDCDSVQGFTLAFGLESAPLGFKKTLSHP